MEMIVKDKKLIAKDIVQFRLSSLDNKALSIFNAGAHIELEFEDKVRQYSLTSSPKNLEYYEICVLRLDNGRGGSTYLHEKLKVGDKLNISLPINGFPLVKSSNKTVFIAGGIGITPFINMMEELHDNSSEFELHYSARSNEYFIPMEKFNEKTAFYPNKNGRRSLNVEKLIKNLDPSIHLYVCGPRTLIDEVRNTCRKSGWKDSNVHFESFGFSKKPNDLPIKLKLALSEIDIQVMPGNTILDTLLENGIWVPYECKRGECATCMTEVLSGKPDHRDVCLDEEQRKSYMCTCVSWSNTNTLEINL